MGDEHKPIEEQPQQTRKEMSAFERATLRLSIAACFVAGIAAFLVGLQWHVMKGQLDQMTSSGAQTDNLIQQAIAQANAARATADSTKDIAERTLRQAEATNRLARETKRSADIADNAMRVNREMAQEDRRPWVGLQGFRCDNCVESKDAVNVYLVGIISNIGKTPAVRMSANILTTIKKRSDPIPDIDSLKIEMQGMDNLTKYDDISSGQIRNYMKYIKQDEGDIFGIYKENDVLPPNGVREIGFIQGGRFSRQNSVNAKDRIVIYVVGDVYYYDVSHSKKYKTRFCLMNDFGTEFFFCGSGNDME